MAPPVAPPTLSAWLSAVPLARKTPFYYLGQLSDGEFTPSDPDAARWTKLKVARALELGAGRQAKWSASIGARLDEIDLVASDYDPPVCRCAQCVAADHTRLGELAASQAPFDLIFGSHVLCTCRWIAAPLRFLGQGTSTAGITCGGVSIEPDAVSDFVAAVRSLLRPEGGVAVFDQEGGWPFGLEALLRQAAHKHGLHLYVRRGPLWTKCAATN